jgi:hypothetical protein
MPAKCHVSLTQEERHEPDSMARKGKNPARVILSALALLFCDKGP